MQLGTPCLIIRHSALQNLLNVPLALVQWSSKLHIQYSTPLFNGSLFNDLYVQTRSSPGMNLIHVAPSLLEHFDVKLPVCVALLTCPFNLSSRSISAFSPSFSSSYLCLCLLSGPSPWRPVWALRPMLANISGEKEWKRRGEREGKPDREREETKSKTLSRHGSKKYICLGERVQLSSFNYLLRGTCGKRRIPKCRDEERGQGGSCCL